ncbi:hypothetical protein B296_00028852 [Ensete ventricosum]|uniref:Homeobox domain-containing protein n=1 Tax=Ensete ventricosum TaxID=4639 RepID=A0A427ACL5_ENSVE|nr:hypothetical protein B296_00028852 [Ensete ventricosum]
MQWEKGSGGGGDDERNDDVREGRGGGGGGEAGAEGEGVGEGILCVKVMTDEQMEVLRRQIAIYSTICEKLVEMHKAITAHHDSLAGMRVAGIYNDPLMASGNNKITGRQRWTPTAVQLQILEAMFNQGNGMPSKQKIKEITVELSQHGQISESNVYNWFQNRRARSKRKHVASLPSNTESEAEAYEEIVNEKKPKSNQSHHDDLPVNINNNPIRDVQINAEIHSLEGEPNQAHNIHLSNDSLKSSSGSGHMTFYDNILSTPRYDHLMEKFDVRYFSPYHPEESYDIIMG